MSYKLADGSDSTDYAVGDTFNVVSTVGTCIYTKIGDIVTLTTNDSSKHPLFDEFVDGVPSKCCSWESLQPTVETLTAVHLCSDNATIGDSTPETPRQILEQAFIEIFEKYGIVVNEVNVDWINTSNMSEIKRRVENITINGDCVR